MESLKNGYLAMVTIYVQKVASLRMFIAPLTEHQRLPAYNIYTAPQSNNKRC